MGNMFNVFSTDPDHMPGQGLAQSDNLNMGTVTDEYKQMLEAYRQSQAGMFAADAEFDPKYAQLYADTYKNILPQMTGALDAANTQTRTSTLQDYQNLMPGYAEQSRQTLDLLNPQQAGLYNQLSSDALLGLKAGSRLSPGESYQVSNATRQDWASRGLGMSMPASLDEAVNLSRAGDNRLAQRQGAATQALGLGRDLYTNPGMAMVMNGMGAQTGAQGATAAAVGNDGSSDWMQSLLGLTYQQNQLNNRDTAQLETKIGMDQADKWNNWFSFGAGAMCWAAREVFGEEEGTRDEGRGLKWMQFRHWLLFDAPKKLRTWYLHNGERWAERLKHNPAAKSVVRRWMERRIAV